MADIETGVAAEEETAETEINDSSLISFGEIAKAAGMDKFFENATEESEEDEPTDEVEEEESEEEELEEELEEEPTEESGGDESNEESNGVKKRIGKLIEARKKAEAEAEELKSQLEKFNNPETNKKPKGLDKFDEISESSELQKREDDAEHLREWLLENPDGGDYVDTLGSEHEVDYDQARKLMVETDRDLRKNIPMVRQKLQQRDANTASALKTFQWMSDKESPESQEVMAVLGQNNYMREYYKKDPFAVLTMGYAIEGIKAINAKNAAKQKKAPSVIAQTNSPVKNAKKSVLTKSPKLKKTLLQKAQSGSTSDAASYIETLL